MNRVCCGAVNLSGTIHGEAVFKMNTTTSCGKVQTNPQNQWDSQEKYHCVWNSSRGFWEIYGSKVKRVGLLNRNQGAASQKIAHNFETKDGLLKFLNEVNIISRTMYDGMLIYYELSCLFRRKWYN